MRVLHINCNYTNSSLHRIMFRHLTERGEHRAFIPTSGEIPFTPMEHEIEDVCFSRLDRYLYLKKQAQIIRAAEKDYDVGSFECIHAYTLFTDGNCAMQLSKKYGIPYVVAVRNTDINGFFKRRWLLRGRGIQVLENASAVFFLSEEYRRIMLEKYIPRSKWEMVMAKSHVIPNGVDPFWLENLPPVKTEEDLRRIESGSFNLIFSGRIFRYKNPLRTAEAVKELNARGYRVHFTAVGPAVEEKLLSALRKYDHFTYIPSQPKEKLLELYRANDLFVMPSTDETFGLVYPEAMSQGLPVIYSVGEGFYGQFPEGEAGYGVDPHDTTDVAEKILMAVRDYRAISARCPALARKFDWEAIADRYCAIYEDVIKNAFPRERA